MIFGVAFVVASIASIVALYALIRATKNAPDFPECEESDCPREAAEDSLLSGGERVAKGRQRRRR